MNLDEIGVFKNRVVSKLINDENVLDVLLGNTDDIDDPETLLLGKNGSGEGGCVFKYEYVPDKTQKRFCVLRSCQNKPAVILLR